MRLNNLFTDDDDRGQVGIGTLIIFIALVLVAAVAAGVLVNTAGLLQSKAEDTGADAQSQVSNQIDVVSATGETDGSSKVNKVVLTVKKSPGSDPIDLSDATIQYVSQEKSVTFNGPSANDISTGTTGKSTANATHFGVDATLTSDQDGVLEDNSERVKITVDADAISDTLGEGEDATLRIVDQSGASTIYGVNVPDTISDTYVLV